MSRAHRVRGFRAGWGRSTETRVSLTLLGFITFELSRTSLNRIGNLLVPNSNYCAFEDWILPILDKMVAEQEGPEKAKWSPSSVIRRLGKEIDNEESVYYWCYKVGLIPAPSHTTQLGRVAVHMADYGVE